MPVRHNEAFVLTKYEITDSVSIETTAYKVLTLTEWDALNVGTFPGTSADLADGFVHLSTATQLAGTIERYYPDTTALIVAAIDLTALGAAVRWEASRDGQLFPHAYTRLTSRVVLAWCPLERNGSGEIRLPR